MRSLYSTQADTYDSKWETYLKNTVAAVVPELKKIPSCKYILDYGCGTGEILFRYMHSQTGKQVPEVTGYDPSRFMLEQAREKIELLAPDIQKKITLTTTIPKQRKYSFILCTNVLHYFTDPEKVLEYFYTYLEPKGTVLIMDYSKESFLLKHFERGVRMFDTQHVRAYLPHEEKVLIEDCGFEIIDEKNLLLDTFWKGFFL